MISDDEDALAPVSGDVGGWISGPSLDVGRLDTRQLGGPRFGINVGAWRKEYGARYVLQGGFDGFGFVCWRRGGGGRVIGSREYPDPDAAASRTGIRRSAGRALSDAATG